MDEGYTPRELRQEVGFTTRELAGAGLSAKELVRLGMPPSEVAGLRRSTRPTFTARECREAGCSVLDLFGAGRRPEDVVAAGFTAAEFARAGVRGPARARLGVAD